MGDAPTTVHSENWTGELPPPRRRQKINELSTTRLVTFFALFAGLGAWAAWAIYRGFATGRIMIPLCRHGNCEAGIQGKFAFGASVAGWVFIFLLMSVLALGLGIELLRRARA